MAETPNSELLRVSEFALGIKMRESTVRAWLGSGKLTFVRLNGRAIRIPRTEIDRLIREGTVPARPRRGTHRAR
jgi:excisionase family DNA binding protein